MKQSYNQTLNSKPSITYYAIENNKSYTYAIHVILLFPFISAQGEVIDELLAWKQSLTPGPSPKREGSG